MIKDKEFEQLFFKPNVFSDKTGFPGRKDIVLYYDYLNRIENCIEINKLIESNDIDCISVRQGFDKQWDEKKKEKFLKDVKLNKITRFFSKDIDYQKLLALCPKLCDMELDLRKGQKVDVTKAEYLKFISITGFDGTNVVGLKDGVSLDFCGKRGLKFDFPNSLPKRLKSLSFTYYNIINLDSLNLKYLANFYSSLGGKIIQINSENEFIPYLESIIMDHGNCSFITSSFIKKAVSLKTLIIENCAPITSLRGISSLEHVSITGTDILDKDLTPLKSSKYVNVTDKKGFKIKNKDLPKHNR